MRSIILLQTDMCVDMDFYYQFKLKFIYKLESYKYSRAPISCASIIRSQVKWEKYAEVSYIIFITSTDERLAL